MQGHYIDGQWMDGEGESMHSTNPATDTVEWSDRAASVTQANNAIRAACNAGEQWARTTVDERIALLNSFARLLRKHRGELAMTIRDETGKPNWEAQQEVDAMIGKVPVTIDAWRERQQPTVANDGGANNVLRYKPIGAVVVFGPFNLPGHLPNGHLVPAVLAGNTVVFKPSELTPKVACHTVALWEAAGVPAGVLNLVQGGADVGVSLVNHPDHSGVLFTGSVRTGLALRHALVNRPNVMLALEMGGNNPLVVHEVTDIDAAIYGTIMSAFITAGQRCTCARRVIITKQALRTRFLERLLQAVEEIRIAPPDAEPAPFFGPMITSDAAKRMLAAQTSIRQRGGSVLVPVKPLPLGPAYISPGVVDVTEHPHDDEEMFGPLLQLIRVSDLDEAIQACNATRFGLAASIFTRDRCDFERFADHVRAGVINWNRQTTQACGQMPFGGVGISGNHRPSGYFAIDYCAYPIASQEHAQLTVPDTTAPGVNL